MSRRTCGWYKFAQRTVKTVISAEEEDTLLPDGEQHSLFDPTGGIVVEAQGDDVGDPPY